MSSGTTNWSRVDPIGLFLCLCLGAQVLYIFAILGGLERVSCHNSWRGSELGVSAWYTCQLGEVIPQSWVPCSRRMSPELQTFDIPRLQYGHVQELGAGEGRYSSKNQKKPPGSKNLRKRGGVRKLRPCTKDCCLIMFYV